MDIFKFYDKYGDEFNKVCSPIFMVLYGKNPKIS